jgi:hypothetical protein
LKPPKLNVASLLRANAVIWVLPHCTRSLSHASTSARFQ